jgi:excisionase family DNA binding protein
LQLRISYPTIKQWIYKKKIRSNRTAGGHHRILQSEVDRLLFRTGGKSEQERKEEIRRVSGRNQLVG